MEASQFINFFWLHKKKKSLVAWWGSVWPKTEITGSRPQLVHTNSFLKYEAQCLPAWQSLLGLDLEGVTPPGEGSNVENKFQQSFILQ